MFSIVRNKRRQRKNNEEKTNDCFKNSNVATKSIYKFEFAFTNQRRDISDQSGQYNKTLISYVACAAAPERLKPTIEWQNIQVADFSDIRMYISRLIAKKALWPSKIKKVEIENNILGWKQFFSSREPTLSCVLGVHLAMLDHGLDMLTKMLQNTKPGDTIDHKTGQWIYAFMACTRQPLLSDTISILRNLARQCAKIRSHINPDNENASLAVTPLNIFICLVGRYFRQYDLAD